MGGEVVCAGQVRSSKDGRCKRLPACLRSSQSLNSRRGRGDREDLVPTRVSLVPARGPPWSFLCATRVRASTLWFHALCLGPCTFYTVPFNCLCFVLCALFPRVTFQLSTHFSVDPILGFQRFARNLPMCVTLCFRPLTSSFELRASSFELRT